MNMLLLLLFLNILVKGLSFNSFALELIKTLFP